MKAKIKTKIKDTVKHIANEVKHLQPKDLLLFKGIPIALIPIIIPLLPIIYKMNGKVGYRNSKPSEALRFFNGYYVKGNKNTPHYDEHLVEDIAAVAKTVIAFIKKILQKKKKGEKLTAVESDILSTAGAALEGYNDAVSDNGGRTIVVQGEGSKKGSFLMYENFDNTELLQMNVKVCLLSIAMQNPLYATVAIVSANVLFFIAKWRK